jgi:hypothetical protein
MMQAILPKFVNYPQHLHALQSVSMCGMTLADGALGRNEGGIYHSNALFLKAQLHSQLMQAATDVIKFFSGNPSPTTSFSH